MADPVSIIGTVGALANIIQLVSQTISGIRDLQSDWKDADLNFLSLLGQLSTLRVALLKIDAWMKSDFGDAHHQLVLDLDATMDCCGMLLTNLQESVGKLQQRQDHTLDFQSKVRLMFGKKGIGDIQRLLEHQTNALTLLLAACNCETSTEQNELLVRSSSRKTFGQLNQDSASLVVHRDGDSISTQTTDGLSKLSIAFSFDQEVFNSSVYERYFRGFAKKVLRNPQKHDKASREQSQTNPSVSQNTKNYENKVLLFGYDDTQTDEFLSQIFTSKHAAYIDISLNLKRAAVYRYLIINVKRLIIGLKASGFRLCLEINLSYCAFLLGYVDNLDPAEPLDARVGEAIKSFWRDPALQTTEVKRPVLPLIYLLCDIDRITAADYTPTAVDIDAVGGKLPVVMELQVIYQQTDRESRFLDGRLLDVTLRFMTPGNISRSSASVDYDFTGISNILLLGNGKGAHVGSNQQYLINECVECIASVLPITQAPWFPRDKSLIIVFQNLSVHQEQAVNCAFLDNHVKEFFRSHFRFPSLVTVLCSYTQRHDEVWRMEDFIQLLRLGLVVSSDTPISEGTWHSMTSKLSGYRSIIPPVFEGPECRAQALYV